MKDTKRVDTTANRLREAMQEAGKKQIDLTAATGIIQSNISRYLSGVMEPRREAVHKLAVALDVSEMWLYGYDVPKRRTPEQKKNDALVSIIAQLRVDPEFLDVVSMLATLSASEYASIKQIIAALGGKK